MDSLLVECRVAGVIIGLRLFLLLAALTAAGCSLLSRSPQEATRGPSTFTHDPEWLAGKPFSEIPDFPQFLEKQKNRHALLLADLGKTRSLSLVDERHQVDMMLPPLKLRKMELDSILGKLANVIQWSPEQRQEIRAVLEEELRWVNESITGLESAR